MYVYINVYTIKFVSYSPLFRLTIYVAIFTFDLNKTFCCLFSSEVRRFFGFDILLTGAERIDDFFFSEVMDGVLVRDGFLPIKGLNGSDLGVALAVDVSMATGPDDPSSRRAPNMASTSRCTPFTASLARTSFSYTCNG